jgi:outer membrane protein assembly factor BamB
MSGGRMRRLVFAGAIVLAGIGAGIGYLLSTGTSTKLARHPATRRVLTTARPSPKPVQLGVAWPTYGYDDARTHVAPASFKLRPPFRQLWEMRARYYVEFPPSVAYGKVYIGQLKGIVYAVDSQTGAVVWQHSFPPDCTFASPTIADGVVYETFIPPPCDYGDRSKPGFVAAVRASNGKQLWRYTGPGSESTVLLRDGTIYFGSWDHHLYALDVRHGRPRLRWRFLAGGELNSSPAYADGTIYIGSDDDSVYAVDAGNGRLRWRFAASSPYGTSEYFYATPTLAYGRVYIGNTDGTVYALSAHTGHVVWTQHAGTYVYTAAAVWNRTVFVGSYDGNVYALDAGNGRIRWKTNLGGSIHGAPTVLDGLVYFSTCGTCGHRGSRYAELGPRRTFALDARTGRIVWRFNDGHYSPLVSDGHRIYLMGNTVLYALVPRP